MPLENVMSEQHEDQSFEDAFDELASDDASEPSYEDTTEELSDGEEVQEQGEEEALRSLETSESDEPEESPEAPEVDELTAAREEAQLWQHKYNSDLGRQNAFQKKLNEQQQYIQQLESERTSSKPSELTPAEWKAVQDDYPDIAQGVQSQFQSLEARHQAEIASIRAELAPMQQQSQDAYISNQYQILSHEHPDYAEIAQSQEFTQWIGGQPDAVRSMIESEDATTASFLIQTYKNSLAPAAPDNTELKQRRDKQLQQAQTIPKRGGRTVSSLPPDDDFEAAFYADR
jgi:hypothetical protein